MAGIEANKKEEDDERYKAVYQQVGNAIYRLNWVKLAARYK